MVCQCFKFCSFVLCFLKKCRAFFETLWAWRTSPKTCAKSLSRYCLEVHNSDLSHFLHVLTTIKPDYLLNSFAAGFLELFAINKAALKWIATYRLISAPFPNCSINKVNKDKLPWAVSSVFRRILVIETESTTVCTLVPQLWIF